MSIEIKQVKRYVSKDGEEWPQREDALTRDRFLLRKAAVEKMIAEQKFFQYTVEHQGNNPAIDIEDLADAIANVGDELIAALTVKQKRRPRKPATRPLTTDGAPINMTVTLKPAPGVTFPIGQRESSD